MAETKQAGKVQENIEALELDSQEENAGRVESGILLRMNEKNLPTISIIGEVSVQEITSYRRLLDITEEDIWARLTNVERKEDQQEGDA